MAAVFFIISLNLSAETKSWQHQFFLKSYFAVFLAKQITTCYRVSVDSKRWGDF